MSVNGPDSPGAERQGSQPVDHLDLYVKAGSDGSGLGGCPICHRMFMVLMIKHNAGALTFTATTIDPAHPAKDWKLGTRLPILVHKDEVLTEIEEMIAYVDKTFPEPPMLPELPKANEACVNVFSKFNYYLKNPSARGPGAMVNELRKIDSFLRESQHKFLCGDEISHLDCIMLPKLQHMRVVVKAYKDFDMPSDMRGLWGYLANAYNDPVFVESCPSDQEIVYHWKDRKELPPMPKEAAAKYKSTTKAMYSFDVPEDVHETKPLEQQNEVPSPQETPASPATPTTPTTPDTPSAPQEQDPPAAFSAPPPAQEPARPSPTPPRESTPEPPAPPEDNVYEIISASEAPPAAPPTEDAAEKQDVESTPREADTAPAIEPSAPLESPIYATPGAYTSLEVSADVTDSSPAADVPPSEPTSNMNAEADDKPRYAEEPFPIS